MPYALDFNRVLAFEIEKDTVVAATEAKTDERGLQFFDISGAAAEVSIQAVEDLHGRFAVDSPELGACLRRP